MSTHTCTVRLTRFDYDRLRGEAREVDLRLSDLLRHYISNGLRNEKRLPLDPVAYRGRPVGARNRRQT